MTVVVTGASGFIGAHLVGALLGAGASVVGIDRRAPVRVHRRATFLVGDLAEPTPAMVDALGRADAVAHLAARPGVRDRSADVRAARHRDNVVATERVLSCVPRSTPLVVASSSSVYGGSRRGRPCHEDDPLRPLGGYARSKALLERRCAGRAADGGRITVVRPFTVVGEGQRPDMALARWVAQAEAGEPLTVFGSVERWRDFTDVHDVVRVLVALLERGPTTTVNIGTGRAQRLGALVDAVHRAVATTGVHLVPATAREPDRTLADPRRCAQLTGVSPSTDLDAVVARHLAATSSRAAMMSVHG